MLIQVEGVAPWPLDAGAELIAGQHSIVKKLADNYLDLDNVEHEFANYLYWSDTGDLQYMFDEFSPLHHQITKLLKAVRYTHRDYDCRITQCRIPQCNG